MENSSERRIARDYKKYTWQEFQAWYGDSASQRWEEAAPAMLPSISTSASGAHQPAASASCKNCMKEGPCITIMKRCLKCHERRCDDLKYNWHERRSRVAVKCKMTGEDALPGTSDVRADMLVSTLKGFIPIQVPSVPYVRYISDVWFGAPDMKGEVAHDMWPVGLEGNVVSVMFSHTRGESLLNQEQIIIDEPTIDLTDVPTPPTPPMRL